MTAVAKVDIAECSPAQRDRWDAFAREHPFGSIYHLSRWRGLVESEFGHRSTYLRAQDEAGRLTGLLPLVRLRSRLFGDFHVSLPYFNYGGAIGIDEDVEQALMERAATLAQAAGCAHVEFRDTRERAGWPVRTDKVAMELPLPADPATLWNSLGSKLRAQVRRPSREPVEVLRGGAELLPQFYAVFARNMRDLGTPVYPQRFFAAILEAFPEQATIVAVRLRGKPAAAGFLIEHGPRMEIPWASSMRELNPIGVNMLLYWEALRFAIERGRRIFDFGRSTIDAGTYRFKKQWGAQPRPLYWHYWLRPGRELPRIDPGNPRYRLAIRAWQRLPLRVANTLGPLIVKNLP